MPASLPVNTQEQQMLAQMQLVDYVKWLATLIQLVGYGMTGLNMVPYNIYLFFIIATPFVLPSAGGSPAKR